MHDNVSHKSNVIT